VATIVAQTAAGRGKGADRGGGRCGRAGLAPREAASAAPAYAPGVGSVPVTRELRALFWVSTGFVVVAGVQLYVLSARTEDWFAWTIEPPLTAAFLGAFYFASAVMTLPGAMERIWDRASVIVAGVLAFVWLILAATLLHLDKFHLDDSDPVPTVAAWAWLAVYVIEPPLLLWLFWRQLRVPGEESPPEPDMPRWFRGAALAVGALLAAVGAVLFLWTGTSDELWPWALTPLTSRAVAATLIGVGVVLISIGRRSCWARTRWAVTATFTLAALEAVGLLRYSDTFDWDSASGIGFVLVLALVLTGSLYGALAARSAAPVREPGPSAARP
jgi:hypothetical protein